MIEAREKTVFTADEMSVLTAGIKEQNETIKKQADKIKTLENVLIVRNKVIDKYRKSTEEVTLFLNSI